MAINSLSTLLTRPDGSSTPQRETTSGDFFTALAAAQKVQSGMKSGKDTYTVKAGDSLYRIVEYLKNDLELPQSATILVMEMTALNNLKNPDLIFPGQVLQLPRSVLNQTSQNPSSATPNNIVSNPNTAVSVSPAVGQVHAASTPPAAINHDFPIFSLQGNVILPAVIAVSQFAVSDISAIDSNLSQQSGTPSLTVTEKSVEAPTTNQAVTSPPCNHDLQTQMAIYKEDQLLAHPGGDYYFLRRSDNVYDPGFDQSRFVNRIGKDLFDAGENLLNIAKDLALGTQYKYVSETGEIKTGQEAGLLGTLKNFVEDVFSGLSFGAYVPEGEKAPDGALASVGHFFKKICYDGPIGDLLIGIPHALVNVVKDTALASLNLLEVIPDATISNFEWGQKATTKVFDNGQVVIDYLTDVLPGGNAWLRVHAAGPRGDIAPPVYFNLSTSEQGITDSRWAAVRNTPFRKTIETIGSILSDAAIIAVTTHSYSLSSDQRHD